jgi:hypothetical protein
VKIHVTQRTNPNCHATKPVPVIYENEANGDV